MRGHPPRVSPDTVNMRLRRERRSGVSGILRRMTEGCSKNASRSRFVSGSRAIKKSVCSKRRFSPLTPNEDLFSSGFRQEVKVGPPMVPLVVSSAVEVASLHFMRAQPQTSMVVDS